jgi:hypothetical protein
VPDRAAEEYTLYHPAEVELAALRKNVLERADGVQPSCVVVDSLSELRSWRVTPFAIADKFWV